MGMQQRAKGSEFELKISKQVIACSGGRFTSKDCYRMPLSGGHPHAGKADLAMSTEFLKFCPFIVECKHDKQFFDGCILRFRANELNWLGQVSRAVEDIGGYYPLLVMRGNNTPVYCASLIEGFNFAFGKAWLLDLPRILFFYSGEWAQVKFDDFIKALTARARAGKWKGAIK